jgi:hypothetical protein
MDSIAAAPVGEFSIKEALKLGLAKSLTETAYARIAPMAGLDANGTLQSGAVKLAVAYGMGKTLGNHGVVRDAASGMAIDGVEDLLNNVIPLLTGSVSSMMGGSREASPYI